MKIEGFRRSTIDGQGSKLLLDAAPGSLKIEEVRRRSPVLAFVLRKPASLTRSVDDKSRYRRIAREPDRSFEFVIASKAKRYRRCRQWVQRQMSSHRNAQILRVCVYKS